LSRAALPTFWHDPWVRSFDLVSSTPETFGAYVKSELARWTKVLKEIGITDIP
jgi:tripartite-type tricarboxylate transporter receptor subunit TctC